MRITFVLPGSGHAPVGGFKVVYEYANGLVNLGHDVTVVHPAMLYVDTPLFGRAKKLVRYIHRSLDGSYRPNSWFTLDPRVKVRWVFSLEERYIPEGDVVIATAWQTAEWVVSYGPPKGRKFYLVYDYEHYMSGTESVKKRIGKTFSKGMRIIATSPAVIEMIQLHGVSEYGYIPNGIDFNTFKLEISIWDGVRDMIGFPTRNEPFKGTIDAIKALEIIRAEMGGKIKVWTFGGKRPSYVPEWVEYYERPSNDDLKALNNRTAIFIVPSHYEGWGLPGAEAMACGAALVSTENGGVRVYAEDGKTALLCPIKNPIALAQTVLTLLRNRNLRIMIATNGYKYIQQFTWKNAISAMEEYLSEGLLNG